ncbi:cupin domain-containing protein [Pseudonocardia sulfidoxydans]|uniref:cupin domain-containing protein n=1 Tax=Pseudonocardia sulfidoxydans TaxID=54011 RepID=UPI0036141FD2
MSTPRATTTTTVPTNRRQDVPAAIRLSRREVEGDLAPAGRRPGADTGDPQVRSRPVTSGGPERIGVWECAPGGWAVENRLDTETCVILSGRARITDRDGGRTFEISAGDLLVLPAGWSGRWDVVETVRKVFVTC